ncbi:monocarboxylate transporter 12 isoform X2 [Pieris rapae]|uniref:monocarboxylate transporter 12 isoform X2 n=1 Tax=Pieris rapae TaxID=64459 RepID=UPI001E27AC66|nr:monocarboxylate transporter 12 isoform X2 [Pieris rapae]
MAMRSTERINKNYKLVPPDGGWGYMICVGVIINLVVLRGFTNSHGAIYKERFLELDMSTTSVSVLNCLGTLCISVSGFSTGFLLKHTSIRTLGLIAAFFYSTGLFTSTLCDTEGLFFIFQGILQNIGHGLMINLCFTIINQYFRKKRLYAMSIVQTAPALAVLVTPKLVKWIFDRYGSHWTLLLLSAVSLNNVLAFTIMQPVSLNMNKELPENKEIDVKFVSMLPQALYYMGWNEALVARALMLFGLGNLLTRMLFVYISKWLTKLGTHDIYVVGLLIACLSRLGMLWSDNRIIMQSFLVIVGLARAVIEILHPLVIADCVSAENFSYALGVSMLAFGLISVVFGPIISAIRELTDSYATAFYILTSCFAITVIFWTIELVYKRNAHKRKPKRFPISNENI